MAPERTYDLVVIGSGPAGEKAAVQAAYFGRSVAIVERAPEPGGAGVHTGTLPSKTLRETALYLSGHHARELYGVAVSLDRTATLAALMSRKAAIQASESARIRRNLAAHGVELVAGEARVTAKGEVHVRGPGGERVLRAAEVLVATGSRPFHPPGIDFSDPHVHDSDEILDLPHLPERLVVLGAGVIGCEYACMFAALGSQVVLVDPRDRILPFLDEQLVTQLVDSMGTLGVETLLGHRFGGVQRDERGIVATLDDGTRVGGDQLLYAAGRIGNTDGLGLAEIGVELDARGYVKVDARYATRVPGIWAAGDVIGFPALASASMEQGRVAVCHAFGLGYKQAVAETMPYGIYTIPELSGVGETERGARERGEQVVVGVARWADNARGKICGAADGLTKLVVSAESRRLLGVHVIGQGATELVHVGQAVLHLGGTVDLFIDMVFNFPTLAESYKYAAYDCLRALGARGR